MHTFLADIEIIGINPFVSIPLPILEKIFTKAKKTKGYIPVQGTINGNRYQQTLVKYSGEWRLYVNTKMLKDSPRRIGETIKVKIGYDETDRTIKPHPKFIQALKLHTDAKEIFEQLPASRQKEIVRYIANLKTAESIEKNVDKAIRFLLGKERFVGRDKP